MTVFTGSDKIQEFLVELDSWLCDRQRAFWETVDTVEKETISTRSDFFRTFGESDGRRPVQPSTTWRQPHRTDQTRIVTKVRNNRWNVDRTEQTSR